MSDTDDGRALLEQLLSEMLEELRLERDASIEQEHADLQTALKEAGFSATTPREITVLQRTLRNEQDRGCALAGVAFLDFAVTDMLAANMVDDSATRQELFRPSGPLGSFSARISLSYLLGMVAGDAAREMNLLRKIRNEFAHSAEAVTFADPVIADRCKQLSFVVSGEDLPPRRRFIRSILTILGLVHGMTRHATRPPAPTQYSAKLDPNDPRIGRLLAIAESTARTKRSPN